MVGSIELAHLNVTPTFFEFQNIAARLSCWAAYSASPGFGYFSEYAAKLMTLPRTQRGISFSIPITNSEDKGDKFAARGNWEMHDGMSSSAIEAFSKVKSSWVASILGSTVARASFMSGLAAISGLMVLLV